MADFDLKNPGGKEILIFGGGALGLALIYFALHKSSSGSAGTATPATPPAVPGSGGGLGNPYTLPGGQSPTGNPFTDSLVQSPVALATTAAAPVVTPVRHAAQGAQAVLGSGGGGGGISGGAPSGGSITNLSGTTPLQWATSVLTAGGFPKTAANLQSLVAWALNEGGGGANNPLNTTQPAAGASNFNSIGVKNYPNVATGVTATVQTLTNGLYSNIVADLKSGKGISSNAASELSKWSGGGYSSLSGNWARAAGLIVPPKVTTTAATQPARVTSFPNLSGLFTIGKPRAAAKPRAKVKPVGLTPAVGRLVLAFQKAFKAPKVTQRKPVPIRYGHPIL